jgi:hypothetical protein
VPLFYSGAWKLSVVLMHHAIFFFLNKNGN